jgi:hypothetical protein
MTLFAWIVVLMAAVGAIGWNLAESGFGYLSGVYLGVLVSWALQQIGLEYRKQSSHTRSSE